MKRVQQKSVSYGYCGVAFVATVAQCSYRLAFEAFQFTEEQANYYYSKHHHLFEAMQRLGCSSQLKKFTSWRNVNGPAIVAVNHTLDGYWHWVAFDGAAIFDPKPNRPGTKN